MYVEHESLYNIKNEHMKIISIFFLMQDYQSANFARVDQ